MGAINKELEAKIRSLSDDAKLELVDSILMQLDKPDPEIDRVWGNEARKRWHAYKDGKLRTVPYDKVMAKHRSK